MFSPIALLILVIATLTLAAPHSALETSFAIARRAEVPQGVSCAADYPWRYTYTKNVIESARDHLVHFMNLADNDPQKPHTDFNTPYPHPFQTNNQNRSPAVLSALNRDPACRLGQPRTTYLEYPMVDDEDVAPYTGSKPGGDRVIVMVRGTQIGQYSDPVYCLSITHESLPSPHMIPCPTDLRPRSTSSAVPSG